MSNSAKSLIFFVQQFTIFGTIITSVCIEQNPKIQRYILGIGLGVLLVHPFFINNFL